MTAITSRGPRDIPEQISQRKIFLTPARQLALPLSCAKESVNHEDLGPRFTTISCRMLKNKQNVVVNKK